MSNVAGCWLANLKAKALAASCKLQAVDCLLSADSYCVAACV